jgi:DNA-binding transcriptional LysR family regulator
MQLEALKVFCDVARFRSFSQAALVHGRTQSAVSQAVHALEAWLGVQLVDRSIRPLRLTPTGRRFYEGCKELVERLEELKASVRDAQNEIEATVEVAAIYSVGLGDMGQYVERFHALQPYVKVHVDYLHPEQVYEKVLDGTADFGLVSFPRKSRKLAVVPWREEPMVVVCAPGHPLARQRSVRPAQLAGEPFVAFARELVIRREVDRFLHRQGVAVEVVMEFDTIENIKRAVEEAAGVALLPAPMLRREVEAGTLVALPLAGASLVRPLGMIRRRNGQLSAAARQFMELLGEPLPADPRANGAPRGRNGAPRTPRRTV